MIVRNIGCSFSQVLRGVLAGCMATLVASAGLAQTPPECPSGGPPVVYRVSTSIGYQSLGCTCCWLANDEKEGESLAMDLPYPPSGPGPNSGFVRVTAAAGRLDLSLLNRTNFIEGGGAIVWTGVCSRASIACFVRGGPGTPYQVTRSIGGEATYSTNGGSYGGGASFAQFGANPPNTTLPFSDTQVFHGVSSGPTVQFVAYPGVDYSLAHSYAPDAGSLVYRGPGSGGVSALAQVTAELEIETFIEDGEPPTVALSGPEYATTLEPAVFTSTAAVPEGGPLTYEWTADRAASVEGRGTPTATFTWAEPDTYTVTCEVVDCDGRRASETDSVIVVGQCAGPMAAGTCPPCRATLTGPDYIYECRTEELSKDVFKISSYYTVRVEFEQPCACCEYLQEVTSYSRIYRFLIIPKRSRDYGVTHEDTAPLGAIEGCSRDPARYGHRGDPLCPKLDKWPDGASGCTYQLWDRPGVEPVELGQEYVSYKRFEGYVVKVQSEACKDVAPGRTLLKRWAVRCAGVAGFTNPTPIVTIDTEAPAYGPPPDEPIIPIGKSEINLGGRRASVWVDLVTTLLGEEAITATVAIPDDRGEGQAFARSVKLSLAGFEPHALDSSVQRPVDRSEDNSGWEVLFAFSLPSPRPSSVQVTVSAPGSDVTFPMALAWPRPTPTSGTPEPKNTPKRMRILENPALGSVTILVSAETPMEAVVRVFDISGRLVRRLAEGLFSPGENSTTWDQRDDAGRPVPSGLYFLRFEGPGIVEKARLVVL